MKYAWFRDNSRIYIPKKTTNDSVFYNIVDVTGTVELMDGFPRPTFHHSDEEVEKHMGNPIREDMGPSLAFYLPDIDFAKGYPTASFRESYQQMNSLFPFMELDLEKCRVPDEVSERLTSSEFYVVPQRCGGAWILFPREWFLFVDKKYVDSHGEEEVSYEDDSLLAKLMNEREKFE